MIGRYVVLANRIHRELELLEIIVERCERAKARSVQNIADRDLYVAAIALHLHDFYSGIERVLEMIAVDVDDNVPMGRAWHRELLTQMTLDLSDIRPAVLTSGTVQALDEYLRFRHVVRNVYAFRLETEKVMPLVTQLRTTYEKLSLDLEVFMRFLHCISRADENNAARFS
jgi:hypothetical protein